MKSTLRKLRTEPVTLEYAERALEGARSSDASKHDFEAVYDEYFHDVMRWVRAMGGRDSDLEDLAQDVFIIVQRKLPSFDGQNLKGWLYRISQRTVRDYRRAAWFRNLFGTRKVVDSEPALLRLVEPSRGPTGHLEQREAARVMAMILDKMRAKHRTAFVLFEIEGYSGEEIAELESVPLNTIWTRLYHARKEFASIVEQIRQDGRLL